MANDKVNKMKILKAIWIWIVCTFYGHDLHRIHTKHAKFQTRYKCSRCGKIVTTRLY